MNELLRHLGVDPARPDAWLRGFLILAHVHHGIGHLAWYPKRTNRNAARWTPDHDFVLLREVLILKTEGLSERGAVKWLATSSKKIQLFPYRAQEGRHSPKGTEQKRREDALWARLQKLKASASGKSLVRLFAGDLGKNSDFYESVLYDLDASHSLPGQIGEKPKPT